MSAELLNKISERRAVVGVIGLGYVGLPLSVEFAKAGHTVIGFDVDERRADSINEGVSYIPDVPTESVNELVATGKLSATTDFSKLRKTDAVVICVPTPLRKTKEPDISYILAAAEQVCVHIQAPQLIILESTTYPGTTDEVLLPMLEETGLKLDKDFFLAFSPERVDPGNPQFQTHNIPKVVGGVSKASMEVAAALYQTIVDRVHQVSSARVAETAKLLENTFRSVNIAMVNEIAQLCYHLGIDSWEVIQAAATKPFGFMAFYPGPGIGGHCLIGSEMAVIRSTATGNECIEPLEKIFIQQYEDGFLSKSNFENGQVIHNPKLEALSLNIETQKPEWKPVSYLFRRKYEGNLVTITTSDNRRLRVTDEHPMLICDENGYVHQVFAKDVKTSDRLPIHHCSPDAIENLIGDATDKQIDVLPFLPEELISKVRVRIVGGSWRDYRETLKKQISAENLCEFIRQDYLPLKEYLDLEKAELIYLPHDCLRLYTGRGPSTSSFPAVVNLSPEFARLVGYYLAEGCITEEKGRCRVRFSFHRAETEFIQDVRSILDNTLGIQSTILHSRIDQVTHIRAASHLLGWFLRDVLKCGSRSTEMCIATELMNSSVAHKLELLKGLLRGDGDVYVKSGRQTYFKNGNLYTSNNTTAEVGYFSSSPQLFQQVIYLMQGLGFTPTFKKSKPHLQIKGRPQLSRVENWLGQKGDKLNIYFNESRRVCRGRTFKQNGLLTTVSVKAVEITQTTEPTDVYSLEVEDTHTFATSYGIYVHNCIPLDPHYLSWKARLHGFEARFIGLAEEVNSNMPRYVVRLIQDSLNEHGKPLKGAKVLLLGVAYKRDIDDVRESPALGIAEQLLDKGALLSYHDPHIAKMNLDGKGALESVPLSDELLSQCDAVVIVTDHSAIDYAKVVTLAPLIIDTRNATRILNLSEQEAKIIRL
jgi:UDP-N-acetyl-D-mannosaminuronate dehydrogenase/intein/homing endonuclease